MELLRDRSPELEEAGVRAFGISRDSPWTHISWMQALDLTVPLLSDWNAEAARGFRLARSYRGMNDVPVRSAFLVDQGGTVRRAWRYDDAEVPDLDAIVAAAQAL
jgi:peroxiredoxin